MQSKIFDKVDKRLMTIQARIATKMKLFEHALPDLIDWYIMHNLVRAIFNNTDQIDLRY